MSYHTTTQHISISAIRCAARHDRNQAFSSAQAIGPWQAHSSGSHALDSDCYEVRRRELPCCFCLIDVPWRGHLREIRWRSVPFCPTRELSVCWPIDTCLLSNLIITVSTTVQRYTQTERWMIPPRMCTFNIPPFSTFPAPMPFAANGR